MADVSITKGTIDLDLPVRVPELTLKLTGKAIAEVSVNGKPLAHAMSRAAFRDNTFYREGDTTFAAFTPDDRSVTVKVAA